MLRCAILLVVLLVAGCQSTDAGGGGKADCKPGNFSRYCKV